MNKVTRNYGALAAAIGVVLISQSVYQMTDAGMEKVSEKKVEHFGDLAFAQAGGRPVLNAASLQAHSVGVAGQQDVIWNPLYDSISYPSAGQLLFSFYANPIGQGTSSDPGVGAIAKGLRDTNLTIGNQLTSGNEFYMIGSETIFSPGVSNANLPLKVLPAATDVPTTTGLFINDVWSVLSGGLKTLTVGTDRVYLRDGPMAMFPPATRLQGMVAASGNAATNTGVDITYAAASGELYTVVPIYIQSNQNWTLTVSYGALIPTPSTQIGRLVDRMRGYLIRQAT